MVTTLPLTPVDGYSVPDPAVPTSARYIRFLGYPEPRVWEEAALPLSALLANWCKRSNGRQVPVAWAVAQFEEIWLHGGMGAYDRLGRHWGHVLPFTPGVGYIWINLVLGSPLNFRAVD